MARRSSIVVDDELVAAARAVLGTRGLKDTIDAALHDVVRTARRRQLAARLAAHDGLDRDALSDERLRAQQR